MSDKPERTYESLVANNNGAIRENILIKVFALVTNQKFRQRKFKDFKQGVS